MRERGYDRERKNEKIREGSELERRTFTIMNKDTEFIQSEWVYLNWVSDWGKDKQVHTGASLQKPEKAYEHDIFVF